MEDGSIYMDANGIAQAEECLKKTWFVNEQFLEDENGKVDKKCK